MATQFEEQIRRFAQQTIDVRLNQVRRAAILDLYSKIVYSTPVDTGRLRVNWQATLSSPAQDSIATPSSPGSGVATALNSIQSNLGTWEQISWFSNNLPYAYRIEFDGYSAQAPAGMVRANTSHWDQIVNDKVRAFFR